MRCDEHVAQNTWLLRDVSLHRPLYFRSFLVPNSFVLFAYPILIQLTVEAELIVWGACVRARLQTSMSVEVLNWTTRHGRGYLWFHMPHRILRANSAALRGLLITLVASIHNCSFRDSFFVRTLTVRKSVSNCILSVFLL